jgi:uncharacterized delta-60 repeat protein
MFTVGCAAFEGRAIRPTDASVDVQSPVVADSAMLTDASPESAAPDVRSLRVRWPMSVTATNVRFDERERVILSSGAAEGGDRDFALTRFSLAGVLDPLPGSDAAGHARAVAQREGVRLVSVPRAMAVDRLGRVVVAGGGIAGGRRYGIVARWLADGSLDRSFGVAGTTIVEYPAASPPRDLVLRALTIADDGSVIVSGGDAVPLNRATLGLYARLTPSGAIDPTFGGVTVDSRFAALVGVVPDGDGYAFVGDGAQSGAPMVLYVGRDGRARADVGDGGAVTHDASGASPMVVRAVARDVDGGLVIAGGAGPQRWAQTPLQLVRFTMDRAPDHRWGRGGVAGGFSFATWNFEMCHAGALLPWAQGSFLVVGQDGLGYRVHRVLRDGTADPSFGRGGTVSDLPENFNYVFELLSDGRGGLWVFYRAAMEREVGATHYPGLS